jgi:hypothetical protein
MAVETGRRRSVVPKRRLWLSITSVRSLGDRTGGPSSNPSSSVSFSSQPPASMPALAHHVPHVGIHTGTRATLRIHGMVLLFLLSGGKHCCETEAFCEHYDARVKRHSLQNRLHPSAIVNATARKSLPIARNTSSLATIVGWCSGVPNKQIDKHLPPTVPKGSHISVMPVVVIFGRPDHLIITMPPIPTDAH